MAAKVCVVSYFNSTSNHNFVFLAEIADIGARSRLERIAPVESLLRF